MDFKVCRICGGIMQLKNILEDNVMINKLFVCLNIQIQSGDLLPKFICEQCDKNLDVCYRLKKQYDSTQKLLMLAIHRNQNATTPIKHLSSEENTNELYDYEKVALSQCTIETIKINECDRKEVLMQSTDLNQVHSEQQNTRSENLQSDDACFQTITCFDNEIFNNESGMGYKNELNESTDITIASEYYIDLLSSDSTSSNDCEKFMKKKVESKSTDESAYTCDTCLEVFTNKRDYIVHIKQHGLERYQCIQCCKFFPSRFRLKRHEETHNDIPTHQCPHCNRNYRALYNLKRHIRSAHLEKQSLECNVCNVNFSRIDALKRHLLLHSDERKFMCSLCPQSFKTKDYLYAHHKTSHIKNSNISKANKKIRKSNDSKNQCGYCGKLFKSSFAFKNHLLIHANEKPHTCETCNKSFRTIAALTIHQRIHDDYRPYQCELCLKSFRQTSHLKEHKALHLEDAPKHVCSICKASFAKKGNLKAHILTHDKEKVFKCADCSAEFSFIHLLQRHASKIHCRSVHKVYNLTNVDETLEEDDETEHKDKNELFHYIDTVVEDNDNNYESEENLNFLKLVSNEDDNDKTSSDVQTISLPQSHQPIFYDQNCALPDREPIFDTNEIHSINFLQSESTKENLNAQINDNENKIKDQKIDIFVREETRLTSTLVDVHGIE